MHSVMYIYIYDICIYMDTKATFTMLVSQDVLRPWDWLGMKETWITTRISRVGVTICLAAIWIGIKLTYCIHL
jgi:hypothetical protein